MAISGELMFAILAMDSYSRGYGAGMVVEGDQLGNTLHGRGTNEQTEPDAVAASFFAQAFTLADGSTVICYRGTDPGADAWNYPMVLGAYDVPQAKLAAQFYQSVASDTGI